MQTDISGSERSRRQHEDSKMNENKGQEEVRVIEVESDIMWF